MKKKVYPFTVTGLFPKFKVMPENHEYVWDKVVRERKENHPKYLGGNYHDIPVTLENKEKNNESN